MLHLFIYLSHFFHSGLQVLGNNLHDSDLGMTVKKKSHSLRASTQIFVCVHMHLYQLRRKKYSSDVLLHKKKKRLLYTLKNVREGRMGSWCIMVYLKQLTCNSNLGWSQSRFRMPRPEKQIPTKCEKDYWKLIQVFKGLAKQRQAWIFSDLTVLAFEPASKSFQYSSLLWWLVHFLEGHD